jgi:hypothetical protein
MASETPTSSTPVAENIQQRCEQTAVKTRGERNYAHIHRVYYYRLFFHLLFYSLLKGVENRG